MKTLYRLSPGGIALLVLLCVAPAWADPPRTSGKVLLLNNQRTLAGDVQRQGDQFVVRLGAGEMTLPAVQVLRLCADWAEAFAFMQSQANLGDPDERLRLARWCDMNGLHAQALTEAARAVEMRPTHQPSRQLLMTLQKLPTAPPPSDVKQTKAAPEVAPPTTDLSAESLALFNTRIQPILMNTCASCHAANKGGEFKLMRCEDATVNRRATQFNLAAVVAQIRFDRPEVSPLLVKAFSKHGNAAQAPLPSRDSMPFLTLQAWVHQTVTHNPHLRKEAPAAVALVPVKTAPTAPPVVALTQTPPPSPSFAQQSMPVQQPLEPSPAIRPVEHQTQTLPPDVQQGPTDQFSGAIFNQQFHPGR